MKCSEELYRHYENEANSHKDKTSFQIRIFDDNTGAVTYKHLSSEELNKVLLVLEGKDGLNWIEMKRGDINANRY